MFSACLPPDLPAKCHGKGHRLQQEHTSMPVGKKRSIAENATGETGRRELDVVGDFLIIRQENAIAVCIFYNWFSRNDQAVRR